MLVFDKNFKVRHAVSLFAAQRGDQPINAGLTGKRFNLSHPYLAQPATRARRTKSMASQASPRRITSAKDSGPIRSTAWNSAWIQSRH